MMVGCSVSKDFYTFYFCNQNISRKRWMNAGSFCLAWFSRVVIFIFLSKKYMILSRVCSVVWFSKNHTGNDKNFDQKVMIFKKIWAKMMILQQFGKNWWRIIILVLHLLSPIHYKLLYFYRNIANLLPNRAKIVK